MPKKRSLWSLAMGALLLLSVLLAACGPTSGPSKPAGTTPKKGGSIIDGISQEPESLIPYLTGLTFGQLVDNSLWTGLWFGDNSIPANIKPALAKEVPSAANGGISADAKTYTIHLKSGLKFSDGSPLTADDVAFTINLFANQDFGANGFPLSDGLKATVTDPTTVTLNLTTSDVTIVAALADPTAGIMPKSVYGAMKPADIQKSNENNQPTVDSGPFTVKERVLGDHITVVRNPNFYLQGQPYLDQITFKVIPQLATILTALQSGTIDTAWFISINDLDTYKAIQGYTVGNDKVGTSYEGLYFNTKSPILSDKQVRLALTQSFDPKQIIDQIWKGTATYTCDDEPGNYVHDTSLIGPTGCYKVDPTAAGQLLDADGWTMGSDGYRHKGGQTLELRYSTTAGRQYREQTEQLAQAAWKSIGIKIDIKNYPARVLFANDNSGILFSGNFDIGEFARGSGYDPDDHQLWACDQFPAAGGGNNTFYCNPDVDAQFKIETANPDTNVRKQALQTVHKQLIQDVPVMWMYAFPNIYIHRNTLQNYAPSAFNNETWNVYDWWLNK